ncbi:MAG: M14 metallopeptidase family protein, partial [Wenzhouxiangella sp.]|nr:M14 metallopeptidase family protein [Wenzhouxiangella sp.]
MRWMASLIVFLALFPGAQAQEPGAGAGDRAGDLWRGANYDDSTPRFEDVLGFAAGEDIARYAEVKSYFEALQAAHPDRVRLVSYGRSWQGRTLFYAIIGAPERMEQLDAIQAGMQGLADPRETTEQEAGRLIADLPSVAWLAYSVHGNEISPTDAAMLTAYHLLASEGDAMVERILANTLTIIDPLQNPDGRERFIHGFTEALGLEADPDRRAAEHDEPWPSGRVNHYLFDLNRDWIVLTQPETEPKIREILNWYPQVFVDAHEMGSDMTFYFAPEAVPYNPYIDASQRDSLEIFGRNNARWFDDYRIDYFTREIFDAFYPGYGASWPLYFGAVSMTYEQGSVRGLVIRRRDGYEIPYSESVRNYLVASLSTLEAAAENRERLLRNFWEYRKSAIEAGQTGIRFYLLKPEPDASATDKLASVLVRQGIDVERATAEFRACGETYPAGTYAVSLAQPAHRLVRTLLDPQIDMAEDFLEEQERRRARGLGDEIYDVTAWSLPIMFNVAMDACDRPVSGNFVEATDNPVRAFELAEQAAKVAYVVPAGTRAALHLVSHALQAGLEVHTNHKAFTLSQREFPEGSFIVKRAGNPDDLGERLAALARETGAEVVAVNDSWVTDGPNFGSMNVVKLHAPNIALAWDAPTSMYSAGHARFVIERQFDYPVTPVRTLRLARGPLDGFDVIVLPAETSRWGGSYSSHFSGDAGERLEDWVRRGGTLVLIDNAAHFASTPDYDLTGLRREDAAEGRDLEDEAEDEPVVEGTILESADDYREAIA